MQLYYSSKANKKLFAEKSSLKIDRSTTCAFVSSECCISGLRLLASLCQDLDENYLHKGSKMSDSEYLTILQQMALNISDSVVAGIRSVLYLLIKDLNFELLFCYKMPMGQKKKIRKCMAKDFRKLALC